MPMRPAVAYATHGHSLLSLSRYMVGITDSRHLISADENGCRLRDTWWILLSSSLRMREHAVAPAIHGRVDLWPIGACCRLSDTSYSSCSIGSYIILGNGTHVLYDSMLPSSPQFCSGDFTFEIIARKIGKWNGCTHIWLGAFGVLTAQGGWEHAL